MTWRPDGRCGEQLQLADGVPVQCDPRANANRKGPCCSSAGWCGGSVDHCQCSGCQDFTKGSCLYATGCLKLELGKNSMFIQKNEIHSTTLFHAIMLSLILCQSLKRASHPVPVRSAQLGHMTITKTSLISVVKCRKEC